MHLAPTQDGLSIYSGGSESRTRSGVTRTRFRDVLTFLCANPSSDYNLLITCCAHAISRFESFGCLTPRYCVYAHGMDSLHFVDQ